MALTRLILKAKSSILTPILEHVIDNLHHPRSVLKNSNFWTFMQLQGTIKKAIDRNTRVAINTSKYQHMHMMSNIHRALHQDQFTDAYIALSP
jgi:hypothetical protein